MVTDRDDGAAFPQGERGAKGRYVLEGPSNPRAFGILVHCAQQSGNLTVAEIVDRLPGLEPRLEACFALLTATCSRAGRGCSSLGTCWAVSRCLSTPA